jgi:hypothetical protein
MVKPAEVLRVFAKAYPQGERQDFWAKYKVIQQV